MDAILGDTATESIRRWSTKQCSPRILCMAIILLPLNAHPATSVSLKVVQTIVTAILGPEASVFDGHYALGDFDGDGKTDLAIMVNVAGAGHEIESRHIRLVDVDPISKNNGTSVDIGGFSHRCMGLLIVPNYVSSLRNSLTSSLPSPVLSYACYSGIVVREREHIQSQSGPLPLFHGDGLLLEMETGAMNLVYWDGHTFRGFELEGGD